ncbi:MAG: Trk family potassium uptake protein [Chloroflexi bacterium]|nr:Trk family potassium uptake protein [Chloroflexota bacterium]
MSVRGPTSPMLLVYSFFAVAAIGALLLSLPVSSTESGFTPPVGAFFTSVSAMTGTGLIVFDTREAWTAFGQAVIAGLIFIGGLGFMTGAAFLLFITGRRSSLQGRLVVGAGLDDNRLGTIASLARNIILMAIVIQIIGAIVIFVRWYFIDPLWPGISIAEGLWQSVFTAVSAFNNSGFEILPDKLIEGGGLLAAGGSLVGLSRDIPTLLIIGVMILAGSTSYVVLANMVVVRGWHRLTLDTKLVLLGIGVLLLIGFVAFMTLEWTNPGTIGDDSVTSKLTQGVFHTVNRTSGFSTIEYSELRSANLTVTEGMMFVGGASASTAGGIKVSTFMVILITSFAVFSGRGRTTIFGREIPRVNVQRALAVAATAAAAVLLLVTALFVVQPGLDFRSGIFEIVSAFGTVGWSAGASSDLNQPAQIVVAVTMFVGRFGPLTIALFMAGRERQDPIRFATERIRIG